MHIVKSALCTFVIIYTTIQKCGVCKTLSVFLVCFLVVGGGGYYAYQGCIYLIINRVKQKYCEPFFAI